MDSSHRRLFGLLLGAAFGLAYGLVSQSINRLVLPGVPLYQPPLGAFGNVVWMTALGALLGAFTAWPAGAGWGIMAASSLAAMMLLGVSLTQVSFTGKNSGGLLVAAVFLMLPLVALFVPLLGIVRWLVNRELDDRADRLPVLRRAAGPVILLVLLAALGATALHRDEARQELAAMHALLQAGRSVTAESALPAPLQSKEVGGFLGAARGAYTLEWTRDNLNRFRIPRPGRNFDFHAVVLARYADGWLLACLFVAPDEPPTCKAVDGGAQR